MHIGFNRYYNLLLIGRVLTCVGFLTFCLGVSLNSYIPSIGDVLTDVQKQRFISFVIDHNSTGYDVAEVGVFTGEEYTEVNLWGFGWSASYEQLSAETVDARYGWLSINANNILKQGDAIIHGYGWDVEGFREFDPDTYPINAVAVKKALMNSFIAELDRSKAYWERHGIFGLPDIIIDWFRVLFTRRFVPYIWAHPKTNLPVYIGLLGGVLIVAGLASLQIRANKCSGQA